MNVCLRLFLGGLALAAADGCLAKDSRRPLGERRDGADPPPIWMVEFPAPTPAVGTEVAVTVMEIR